MVIGDPLEEEPMTAAVHLSDKRDWTVDDVASLPEDLHYELINGRLVLTPAPLPIHQSIGIRIATALEARCPDDVFVSVDQSVLVDSRNEPRPDVVLIRQEGADRTPVLAADVLLVAEIISPSSKVSDREDKMKLYAYTGIPAYWIIDPLGERITFTQFRLSSGGAYNQQMVTDGLVTIEHPWEVTLDLPGWTRRRDRLRETARPDR
ncbi:Uma2 family endonuclease [Actinoplanes sp. CA-051413]|uniref:Uma2 family endonuclease n=1 Tax=Actinoplanes sp. CA-051413 TaxID=3239899 RepID=UPI003D959E0D